LKVKYANETVYLVLVHNKGTCDIGQGTAVK